VIRVGCFVLLSNKYTYSKRWVKVSGFSPIFLELGVQEKH